MDSKSSKRSVIHRGSAWTNEEHNMLFHFWRKNISKIDLPGRTEDKLKNKLYGQMQESFAKQGYKRSIKQIRKKIQNLKMDAAKFKDVGLIEDENVRVRVKTVLEILESNDQERTPLPVLRNRSITVESIDDQQGANMAVALFSDTNGSSIDHWNQELNPSAVLNSRAEMDSTQDSFKNEIIKVTETLNKAITSNDYSLYEQLCDPNLTCFEPEAFGNLVEGLEFHKFYFDSNAFAVFAGDLKVSIVNPRVHWIGNDAACIAYVRILQGIRKDSGTPESIQSEETRLWRKNENGWRCFHFHRSQNFKHK